MLCSGCGKKIPFTGSVCPYCQRDKAEDQSTHVVLLVCGFVGGLIGYMIDGFFYGLCGLFLGGLAGVIVMAAMGGAAASKPPKVALDVPDESRAGRSTAARLAEAKGLLDRGLITEAEYAAKKARLIDGL